MSGSRMKFLRRVLTSHLPDATPVTLAHLKEWWQALTRPERAGMTEAAFAEVAVKRGELIRAPRVRRAAS